MQYAGTIVDDKFLPTINPAMLLFKPESKKVWEAAKTNMFWGYVLWGTGGYGWIPSKRIL